MVALLRSFFFGSLVFIFSSFSSASETIPSDNDMSNNSRAFRVISSRFLSLHYETAEALKLGRETKEVVSAAKYRGDSVCVAYAKGITTELILFPLTVLCSPKMLYNHFVKKKYKSSLEILRYAYAPTTQAKHLLPFLNKIKKKYSKKDERIAALTCEALQKRLKELDKEGELSPCKMRGVSIENEDFGLGILRWHVFHTFTPDDIMKAVYLSLG